MTNRKAMRGVYRELNTAELTQTNHPQQSFADRDPQLLDLDSGFPKEVLRLRVLLSCMLVILAIAKILNRLFLLFEQFIQREAKREASFGLRQELHEIDQLSLNQDVVDGIVIDDGVDDVPCGLVRSVKASRSGSFTKKVFPETSELFLPLLTQVWPN